MSTLSMSQATPTSPEVTNVNGRKKINFDTAEPQAIEFGLKGRDFILREPSHDVARKYRSSILESYTPNAAGDLVPTPKLPNTEAVLIAGCTFEVKSDGTEVSVTEEEVLTWPNRATSYLFKEAKTMGMLTERDMSTVEALEKEISRLTLILAEMKKDKEEGSREGNLQGNGKGSSD